MDTLGGVTNVFFFKCGKWQEICGKYYLREAQNFFLDEFPKEKKGHFEQKSA